MSKQAEAVLSTKRQRLEGDAGQGEDTQPLGDALDAEVWFSDGNIVVAAVDEEKQLRHLFRCHKGVLAQRLPALRDMFEAGAIAESATASEQFQGLPVVRLYDPHEHVKGLLQALYNPCKVPYKWWRRDSTNEVAGIIRLAKKYQAEDLCAHFVEIFKSAWPDSLENWDRRQEEMVRTWLEVQPTFTCAEDAEMINYELPDPVTAIQLGLETDLPSVLPSAFYVLNSLYTPDLQERHWYGVRANFHSLLPVSVDALSADALKRFMQGREWIMITTSQLLQTHLLALRPSSCERPEQSRSECSRAIREWWKEQLGWVLPAGVFTCRSPLTMLKGLKVAVDDPLEGSVCNGCRNNLKENFEKGRRYIWEQLPIYFNLQQINKDPVLISWDNFKFV